MSWNVVTMDVTWDWQVSTVSKYQSVPYFCNPPAYVAIDSIAITIAYIIATRNKTVQVKTGTEFFWWEEKRTENEQ